MAFFRAIRDFVNWYRHNDDAKEFVTYIAFVVIFSVSECPTRPTSLESLSTPFCSGLDSSVFSRLPPCLACAKKVVATKICWVPPLPPKTTQTRFS